MNKAAIERLAAPRAQESETPRGVMIDPASVAALSGAIVAGVRAALLEIGPILARLAAADLIYNTEQPVQVLDNSIHEGKMAATLIKRAEVEA